MTGEYGNAPIVPYVEDEAVADGGKVYQEFNIDEELEHALRDTST